MGIDPAVAVAVRQELSGRAVRQWWVIEQALRLGLPLLPPAEVPLPYFACAHTRQRNRPKVSLFCHIDPAVVAAVRAAAVARGAHHWWVAQEALRLGLPLLPAPDPGLVPDREELAVSA